MSEKISKLDSRPGHALPAEMLAAGAILQCNHGAARLAIGEVAEAALCKACFVGMIEMIRLDTLRTVADRISVKIAARPPVTGSKDVCKDRECEMSPITHVVGTQCSAAGSLEDVLAIVRKMEKP